VRRWTVLLACAALAVTTPAGAHPLPGAEQYRWVDPPAGRTAGNVAPEGRRATIGTGSLGRELWTPDLQLTLSWHDPPVVDVTIDVAPMATGAMADLPGDDVPNGNAYRVGIDPAEAIPGPLAVHLVVPSQPTAVYASGDDGRSWTRLDGDVEEDGTISADLERSSIVLAATHRDRGSPSRLPIIAAEVVVGIVAIAWALRRRRGPQLHGPSAPR
jgi:hypothetical protein